jgi:ElaA protein
MSKILSEVTIRWQRFQELSASELYDVLRFRQNIFVVEQSSPYPDLDGLDQDAWHLLLRAEGGLAGYLRLTPMPGPPPLVRIGRVAVASYLRGRGLGRNLMQDALRLHREQYPEYDVALGAQAHLVPFYQSFGFAAAAEPYDEFGVLHVEMRIRRNT